MFHSLLVDEICRSPSRFGKGSEQENIIAKIDYIFILVINKFPAGLGEPS